MGHFCGNDNRRMKGIDRTTIKQIAMLSMLLDHIGYVFFHGINEGQNAIYITLHLVGRMAFPLFMFLLSDGFFRSRSRAASIHSTAVRNMGRVTGFGSVNTPYALTLSRICS